MARVAHISISSLLSTAVFFAAAQMGFGESATTDVDLFEIHVRPVLVSHCIKCHGDAKQEGGLQLTSLESILAGGDSGPAIAPGAPSESLLLEAIRYESFEMPPDGPLDGTLIAGIDVRSIVEPSSQRLFPGFQSLAGRIRQLDSIVLLVGGEGPEHERLPLYSFPA